MRIGVDARLMHHQPAGISKYTQNLLHSYTKFVLQQNDVTVDSTFDILDFEFVVYQHRRHVHPIVEHPKFQRVTLYSPVQTRLEQFSLPIELLFQSIDLLHCPDFIPPRYSPTPSVITVHDLAFLHWPNFLTEKSAAYYSQIDRSVRHAEHVIVPSESTKQDLARLLGVPQDRMSVIYEAASPRFSPLPVTETRAQIAQKYGLPQKYILYVGTVEPRKNIEGLLRAFRHLLDHYNVADTVLAIAGGYGWLYEETLQVVDELDLGDNALFLGRVPDEDLHKLYVGARCHAHVAHYEGFGLTPLEAMACGTPTIVSNVSSLPEVVGDAALLVDPGDDEEIAIAMHRLLTNDELHAELREKGLQRSTCFSWDEAARQTLRVYQSILHKTDFLDSKPSTELVSLDNTEQAKNGISKPPNGANKSSVNKSTSSSVSSSSVAQKQNEQ